MRRALIITATLAAVVTVALGGNAWKWSVHHHRVADTDGWTWDGATPLDSGA